MVMGWSCGTCGKDVLQRGVVMKPCNHKDDTYPNCHCCGKRLRMRWPHEIFIWDIWPRIVRLVTTW